LLTGAQETAVIKRLVCLANSRKLQGRCIAGREWLAEGPGAWIRPVSHREKQEVSERERMYEDGSDPRLLDIIEVPLIERRADRPQAENWLLDPRRSWKKAGRLHATQIYRFADPPSPLWLNGDSTYHGLNDCVPEERTAKIAGSLRLIFVQEVRLRVFSPSEAFGNPKRRVQAQFAYGNDNYRLWVTDPLIETAYLARPDGDYKIAQAYLTISLGELYGDRYYKLVAAIIGAGY
jgi:hypothetical protein